MCHNASRENNKQATGVEPVETVAKTAGIGATGDGGPGKIDGKDEIANAVDFEDLSIGG